MDQHKFDILDCTSKRQYEGVFQKIPNDIFIKIKKMLPKFTGCNECHTPDDIQTLRNIKNLCIPIMPKIYYDETLSNIKLIKCSYCKKTNLCNHHAQRANGCSIHYRNEPYKFMCDSCCWFEI